MANEVEPMDALPATANESAQAEAGNTAAESPAPSSAYISSEADLIAFTRLPLEERVLTPQLRGVLAESALTGRIRYKWPLLRPLVDFVLEQVLTAYDAETRVEVGPPGPDSVSETVERFQKLLSAFSDAPWTFQRLCEILLEPRHQYSRLPKLVLAIEKCLLVTTELPPTEPEKLPPPPLCTSLGQVNTNPAPVYTNHHAGPGAGPLGGPEDGAPFTITLVDVVRTPHVGNHVGPPEHILEDHWPEGLPEGKGPFKPTLHGSLRPGGAGGSGHGSPGSSGGGGSPGADGHGAHHHSVGGAVGPLKLLEALSAQHHGAGGGSPGGSGSGRRSSGGGSLAPIAPSDTHVAGVAAGGGDAMAVDSAPATTASTGPTANTAIAGADVGEAGPRASGMTGEPVGPSCEAGPAGSGESSHKPLAAAGTGAGPDGDMEMEAVQERSEPPAAGIGDAAEQAVTGQERGGELSAAQPAEQSGGPAGVGPASVEGCPTGESMAAGAEGGTGIVGPDAKGQPVEGTPPPGG